MSASVDVAWLALDIGAKVHAFATEFRGRRQTGSLANDPAALRVFLKEWVERAGAVRLLVEATGVYYLDGALIAAELGIEVSVINPKAAHHFAKALQQRNKTDRLDAAMLLEFLKAMPFTRWTPPQASHLELRHFGRFLVQVTEEGTAAR